MRGSTDPLDTGDGHGGLGVAILGGGFMATVHSRAAAAAGAHLVGVLSSTAEKSRDAASALRADRAYACLDEVLADDAVNVVHVCTPNHLHAEQVSALIAAGKHVVCEKPLATTPADAERLVAEAEAARIIATVPFVYRFHPLVREARARVRSGELGQLLTISGAYLQDWLLDAGDDNWRVDQACGGRSRAFADIGSHLVDLVEFVTGDRIARLSASARTYLADRAEHREISTEDAVAVTVETEAGAIGTLLVSQVAAGRKNGLRLEIAGRAESVAFDQEHPESMWVGRRTSSEIVVRDPDALAPDAARLCTVPAGHPQGFQDAFNAFVADTYAAIGGADPDGLPRFRDGLRTVQITDAVMDAAAEGGWKSTWKTSQPAETKECHDERRNAPGHPVHRTVGGPAV